MFRRIKEKLIRFGQWIKSKWKAVLFYTGIITMTALAMGAPNGSEFTSSSLKYPPSAGTDFEKMECVYRAQELLQEEYNIKGKEHRDKKITDSEWEKYKVDEFFPRSYALAEDAAKLGALIGDIEIGTTTATGTMDIIPWIVNARKYYKEEMKTDTKWDSDINIKDILK